MNDPDGDAPVARDALGSVLSAHFDHGRLGAASRAYLYASAVPSLVLWLHAWRPLPGLLVWIAGLVWGACGLLAGICSWGAVRSRQRLAAALPRAQRVVRIQFSAAESGSMSSSLLLLLSVAASSVLWLHDVAPGLVTPAVLALDAKAWALLLAAALGNRYVEALS
jgi:hypothetical protein